MRYQNTGQAFRWPCRIVLLAITASATWLGPFASGMLTPIPVIAWSSTVLAYVQDGRQEMGKIIRGNAIGGVGVLGGYLLLELVTVSWGGLPSISAAVVATFMWARVLDRG
ncbi:hypothetical protein JJQ97_07360 [Pseudomonas syringae]|nr:hypothetical protein [Pseudomonas syringae]QQQ52033.1 hypothetical protein JJQ97_07360 [Pseudomonas syringae]